jgi:hypothetical protein
MDALEALETVAKAARSGCSYLGAIRQAYRDAKAVEPQSDYYASGLGVAEEGGEALEPHFQSFYIQGEKVGPYDGWVNNPCESGCDCGECYSRDPADETSHHCQATAPTVEPRMECESVDAAEPFDWCGEHGTTWGICGDWPHGITPVWIDPPATTAPTEDHRGYYESPTCEEIDETAMAGFAHGCYYDPGHDGDHRCLCGHFWPNAPQSPPSSAGRGVGSPGVSAGAEESAPPGKRTTPGEFAAVAVLNSLADHQFRADPGSDPDFDQAGCCTCSVALPMDEYDWREHVAAEIRRRIDAAITTSQ